MKRNIGYVSLMVIAVLLLSSCAPIVQASTAGQSSSPQVSAPNPTTVVAQNPQPVVNSQSSPASQPAQSSTGLYPEEQQLVDLYAQINPSVVSIQVVIGTSTSSGNNRTTPQLPLPQGHPNVPQNVPQQAQGSGFIFDTQGNIVTNNHVIDGATKITVVFSNGTEADAKLVGADPSSDLAVVKVNADPSLIKPVTLGDSSTLKVGQSAIAIGNPFGQAGSMSTGIISGVGRVLPTGTTTANGQQFSIPDIIQTDAAINPGNSGGPLLDSHGNVVGVNFEIDSPVRASSGVGYAIPSAIVKQVIPQLISNGAVEHPWLGISGIALDSELATAMKLDANQKGILIVEAISGGPADKAGLKGSTTTVTINGVDTQVGGDVIMSVNGKSIATFDDLLGFIVQSTKIGDTVDLQILRNGTTMDVKVTLQARPKN